MSTKETTVKDAIDEGAAKIAAAAQAETDKAAAAAKVAADKVAADAKAAADMAAAEAERPLSKVKHVVLDSVYGFYDDAGKLWHWIEGQVVTEKEHIKTLLGRKAPITVVAHDETPAK